MARFCEPREVRDCAHRRSNRSASAACAARRRRRTARSRCGRRARAGRSRRPRGAAQQHARLGGDPRAALGGLRARPRARACSRAYATRSAIMCSHGPSLMPERRNAVHVHDRRRGAALAIDRERRDGTCGAPSRRRPGPRSCGPRRPDRATFVSVDRAGLAEQAVRRRLARVAEPERVAGERLSRAAAARRTRRSRGRGRCAAARAPASSVRRTSARGWPSSVGERVGGRAARRARRRARRRAPDRRRRRAGRTSRCRPSPHRSSPTARARASRRRDRRRRSPAGPVRRSRRRACFACGNTRASTFEPVAAPRADHARLRCRDTAPPVPRTTRSHGSSTRRGGSPGTSS